MYRGTAHKLHKKGELKRPFLLYVYDDVLIIVQPPFESPTISWNESRHNINMAYLATAVAKAGAAESSASLLAVVRAMVDPKGGPGFHDEVIPMQDILSVTVTPKRIQASQIVLDVLGNEPLTFLSDKKPIMEFAGLLAVPLGDRVVYQQK